MAKYLVVVPHYTADSPLLMEQIRAIVRQDPESGFVCLTPARVPSTLAHVAAGIPDDRWEAAAARARRTRTRLEAIGARVLATRVGPWDPLEAIEAELCYGDYAAVLISTLPHPVSHRLHRDLPARLASRHPEVTVVHVVVPANFYRQSPQQARRAESEALRRERVPS